MGLLMSNYPIDSQTLPKQLVKIENNRFQHFDIYFLHVFHLIRVIKPNGHTVLCKFVIQFVVIKENQSDAKGQKEKKNTFKLKTSEYTILSIQIRSFFLSFFLLASVNVLQISFNHF